MKNQLNRLLMVVIIFTALFSTFSCTTEDDKGNQPPATPLNFSPADKDTGISVLPTLAWSACIDPDNDPVTYDIYLGKTNPPPLVESDHSLNNFKPDTLLPYSTYYWKVIAKDNKGNSAPSTIWSFRTAKPIQVPGNIKVLVCDVTQTNYFGGAGVFLYLTEAERNNDPQRVNYYRKATTDNSNPMVLGAMFYELPYQKYFMFARMDLGGGNFLTGVTEGFVVSGNTVTFLLIVQ